MQRVGVHDQRQRRAGFIAMMVTALKPAVRAGKHYLWHRFSSFFQLAAPVHGANLVHTKGT
jgi:hypothetical protein